MRLITSFLESGRNPLVGCLHANKCAPPLSALMCMWLSNTVFGSDGDGRACGAQWTSSPTVDVLVVGKANLMTGRP